MFSASGDCVSAAGDTKHAHPVPPWFPSNKKLILSFNTKCLHLFTTYCIIATLEFNSLHSYAVKTISLLLSHIYIQVLLHMPLSRILNTESLLLPTTTSCMSPTFLCKVTSLQNIGIPADLLKTTEKALSVIFSVRVTTNTHVFVSNTVTLAVGELLGEEFSQFHTVEAARSVWWCRVKTPRLHASPTWTTHGTLHGTTRPSTAPYRTDWNISNLLLRGGLKLDQCIWQLDHENLAPTPAAPDTSLYVKLTTRVINSSWSFRKITQAKPWVSPSKNYWADWCWTKVHEGLQIPNW